MSDKFPDLIDPLLFAERRSALSGELKIAVLERLSDSVVDRGGSVSPWSSDRARRAMVLARRADRRTGQPPVSLRLLLRPR